MSEQKPKLTLKFPSKASQLDAQGAAASPQTPQSASLPTPKIILKLGSSATTPAATPKSTPKSIPKLTPKSTPKPTPKSIPAATAEPKSSKSGRKTKPTAKKRSLDTALANNEYDENESEIRASSTTASAPPSESLHPPLKKIRFSNKRLTGKASDKPTIVKIIRKGQIPERPKGVGYDSEASDREDDPSIDEDFILRMLPGEDCDYLRAAIKKGTLGLKRDEGGADVQMRFLNRDGRRACLTIRGRYYAAVLVDLPCVIEAMKSWNKKDFYKSADVCQMLLVLGRVASEEEALVFDVRGRGGLEKGELNEKTWQWAHGITPPMRWVRKRRFRKRISTKLVEEDEREVERLLADDEDAVGVCTYRQIDLDALEREQLEAEDEEEYEYEDAEGEVDEGIYDVNASGILEPVAEEGERLGIGEDDDDLEAHFEAEMLKQAHEGDAGLASTTDTTTTAAAATTSFFPATDTIITSSPTANKTANLPDASSTPSAAATPSFESTTAAGGGITTGNASPALSDSNFDSESDDDDDEEGDGSNGENSGPPADDAALEEQQDRQRMREEIADLEAAIAREEGRLKVTPNQILKQKIAKTIQGLRADLEVKMGSGNGGEDGGRGGSE